MSKIHDLLWKKSEIKGKAQWEKVGVLLEKDQGKMSVKLDHGVHRRGRPMCLPAGRQVCPYNKNTRA